jgi:hypothetical protein
LEAEVIRRPDRVELEGGGRGAKPADTKPPERRRDSELIRRLDVSSIIPPTADGKEDWPFLIGLRPLGRFNLDELVPFSD